jgi:LysR family transcriptional activator of glutamate synthase operon
MDIKSFRYFISLARHRSFTKAAKECSVTQTAMSIHIAKLEEKLKFKLFSRNSRNVVLTQAGANFLAHAKRIVKEYEQAVVESYNISLGYEGRLLVGASNFPDAIYIIDYLKAFHKKYPNILVETVTDTEINEPDGFRNLELDAAVCLPYELQVDPDIDVIPLVRRPLRFVVSADHPLADKQKLSPNDLAGEKLFVLQVNRFRHTSDRVNEEWLMSGIDTSQLVEVEDFDDILILASSGLGVGVLPYYLPDTRNSRFVVLDLDGMAPYADLALAYLRDSQNPALKLFLEVVQDMREK